MGLWEKGGVTWLWTWKSVELHSTLTSLGMMGEVVAIWSLGRKV